MNAKFTKGPWKVNGNIIKDEHGNSICEVARYGADIIPEGQIGPLKSWEGNAKLIQQSPAMYEALKKLTSEIHLSKLNIRKDFSLINAHTNALKIIAAVEG